ncbi:MAG: hypothetical protein ACI4DY_00270 [Monoglobaceae bacterium]
MSILGLRASTQEIRYAILENDADGNVAFVNINSENRIKYPATINRVEDKLQWVKSEMDRILRVNPTIEKVYIKTNEYGTETAAKRETTYIDSIFLLSAKEHNIPVEKKLNSQISSTASKAKEYAENRVGRTDKYWNNTIADAVLVAYWGLKHDV